MPICILEQPGLSCQVIFYTMAHGGLCCTKCMCACTLHMHLYQSRNCKSNDHPFPDVTHAHAHIDPVNKPTHSHTQAHPLLSPQTHTLICLLVCLRHRGHQGGVFHFANIFSEAPPPPHTHTQAHTHAHAHAHTHGSRTH